MPKRTRYRAADDRRFVPNKKVSKPDHDRLGKSQRAEVKNGR